MPFGTRGRHVLMNSRIPLNQESERQRQVHCSPASIAMVGDNSAANLYQVMANRCQSLKASLAELREEFDELVEEKKEIEVNTEDCGEELSGSGCGMVTGFFYDGNPYRRILETTGVAVYVCAASSGEIMYWNRSAEKLYGWKSHEVLGKSSTKLLVAEEYYGPLNEVMDWLNSGRSWSGQFPFRKKSGDLFMTLMSRSHLYEEGKITGFVTMTTDATTFNKMNPEVSRRSSYQQLKWHPPRPQIASSATNTASRLLPKKQGDGSWTTSMSSRGENGVMSNGAEGKSNYSFLDERNKAESRSSYKDENGSKFSQPSKMVARFLAKLNIRGTKNCEDEIVHKSSGKTSQSSQFISPFAATPTLYTPEHRTHNSVTEFSAAVYSKKCNGDSGSVTNGDLMLGLGHQMKDYEVDLRIRDMEYLEEEDEIPKLPAGEQSSALADQENAPGKGRNESSIIVGCEIGWERLRLREEVGQGSYAVVYRGIWNGSDIAVKVYFENAYSEGTLGDYSKEIEIMKKLRHPNVLLFMGAVYSPERLAIVTEFLTRGSLFKTLHKNNQALDIRRRLKMGLDCARGMNYLHRRNPPIVHRDLKSSNLLVDRNWTVKVGDFGLSKLKHATFISARSGRGGTPQWMAPEVLRNEPSNEKSDVYSFGVILWELMTVSIPWQHLNSLQVVGVVGFMDRRLELPENLRPDVACLIQDCWRSDPDQRPSFGEIIGTMTAIVQKTASGGRRNSEPDCH